MTQKIEEPKRWMTYLLHKYIFVVAYSLSDCSTRSVLRNYSTESEANRRLLKNCGNGLAMMHTIAVAVAHCLLVY
jgi:hypothetical protein